MAMRAPVTSQCSDPTADPWYLQVGQGGWHAGMMEAVGRRGRVHRITERGLVRCELSLAGPGHVTSPPPVIGQGAVPGQPAAEPPVGHQPRGAEDRGGAQPGGHGEDSNGRHAGRV